MRPCPALTEAIGTPIGTRDMPLLAVRVPMPSWPRSFEPQQIEGAVGAHGAGMGEARADLRPTEASRNAHQRRRRRREIPNLSEIVRAPAVRLARRGDRAGVLCARADRSELHSRLHRLRRERAVVRRGEPPQLVST